MTTKFWGKAGNLSTSKNEGNKQGLGFKDWVANSVLCFQEVGEPLDFTERWNYMKSSLCSVIVIF